MRRAAEDGLPKNVEASDMCMCHMAGALPEQVLAGLIALCRAGALHVSQLQYQAVAQALVPV